MNVGKCVANDQSQRNRASTRQAERPRQTNAADPLRKSQRTLRRAGFLKLENRQPTGSFKLRGATNAVLSLSESERKRGLVTASTGNHGRALAHTASTLGLTATICLSSLVPRNKVEAIRELGADVRVIGKSQDDAMEEVVRLARDEDMNAIPPFDDPRIIAGQGTIGLEIIEDLPSWTQRLFHFRAEDLPPEWLLP